MRIQGREIRLQRPGKILYPEPEVTKAELAQYLLRVCARMLPHLRDRPLTFVRMPDGVDGPVFFQKNTPAHMPQWIPRCAQPGSGGVVEYALVNEPAALVVLADQGVAEIHGWTSTCSRPDKPDRMVFDFDPWDETQFATVREGAKSLAGLMEARGATPFVMTTGSRGLHLVVPLVPEATSREVNDFVDAVARSLVRHDPARFTVQARKAKRDAKVYLDTLRNRPNQTSVSPWSPRRLPGASVAAPVSLDALDDEELDPQGVTIRNAEKWLDAPDPWRHFFDRAVPLSVLV